MKEILNPDVNWVTDVDVIINILRSGDSVGFTLTGNGDVREGERIAVMRKLSVNVHIPVFAKIEQIVDFAASLAVILEIADFCKNISIDLAPDVRHDPELCDRFVDHVTSISNKEGVNIRWGESFSQLLRSARQ